MLFYKENILSSENYQNLLNFVLEQPFQHITENPNSRRVLQYGYEYQYQDYNINIQELDPIPEQFQELLTEICNNINTDIINDNNINTDEISIDYFNQCIVNEYKPGQGISYHVDNLIFDDYIACFTLNAAAEMEFKHNATTEIEKYYVQPNSLYIMSGEYRYEYSHCMRARKNDKINNQKIPRGTRYSVTFRHLK